MPFAHQHQASFIIRFTAGQARKKQAKHCLLSHFPLIWHYIQVKIGTAGRTPAKRFGVFVLAHLSNKSLSRPEKGQVKMDDKKQSQNTPITIDTFIPVLQRFSQLIDDYKDLLKQNSSFEERGDYLAKLEQIKFDLIKSSIAIYSIACTLRLTKPQKILNLPKDLNPVDGIERTRVQLAIHRNAVFAEANYECMGLLLEANAMKSDSQAVQNVSGEKDRRKTILPKVSDISEVIENLNVLKKAKQDYWRHCAAKIIRQGGKYEPDKQKLWVKYVQPYIDSVKARFKEFELYNCIRFHGTGKYESDATINSLIDGKGVDSAQADDLLMDEIIKEIETVKQYLEAKPASGGEAGEAKKQSWKDDASDYIKASDAIVTFTQSKMPLPTLSKMLRQKDNTIRWMRKGHRCKVHIGDFKTWAEKEYPPDNVRQKIADEVLTSRENQKQQERTKNYNNLGKIMTRDDQ